VLTRKVSFLSFTIVFLAGLALGGESIANWSAPATWSPSRAFGVHTLTDVTSPLPFIGISPCRVADTRGNGFTGSYGPPSLAANMIRTFVIAGQCGIPSVAAAVSFNFGALNVGGAGDLRVFPAGSSVPLVSTLNYNANTPNIANAAIVPLGAGGGITVQADAVSIDLIIDVNGYYSVSSSSGRALGVTYPISSYVSIAGGEAISGFNETSGKGYGVVGSVGSGAFDGAGILGVDRTTVAALDSYNPSAVRGESRGGGNGVLGISTFQGVAGSLLNGSGHEIAYGLLGYNNGTIYGVFAGGNYGGSGAKMFVEPHPTDASKVIRYVSLEGPEAGTYFRGRGKFQNGLATIDVPEDFRMVTDSEGLSIQVTPIGELATVAILRIDLEEILVKASRNVEFFYTVNGVRRTHKGLRPIGPGNEFVPRSADAKMPAYLTEGQKALLVSNGTYNADGTVNMETAERLGWTKAWQEREQPAASANAAAAAGGPAANR
jgi:hypothetical protein